MSTYYASMYYNIADNIAATILLLWKLMKDLTGDEKVDQLTIIISESGTEQLLSVPKFPSVTGQATADVMMYYLSGESRIVSKHSALIQHQATQEERMVLAC